VLGVYERGRYDPAVHVDARGGHWRTTRTPDGPATLVLTTSLPASSLEPATVHAASWGPGAAWAVAWVPELLGCRDDPSGFPAHALPARLVPVWTRFAPRWRVPRSGRVLEALVAAVLEQKVTGIESRRSWSSLVGSLGEPAPGPTPRPMHVFPEPETIRRVPSWQWHRWGVQPQQSATLMRVVRAAGRIEDCVDLTAARARGRLGSIDGVGPWTVAETASRALGDADAVSFGDYHLAAQVVYAFTGRRDGNDAQMAELLAPFAGHRHRVQRLVETSGISRPARGPRATITDHRHR
jgi:3-methyladenine DNA glycosylase/8-oxoguanine DNA glycosylase